MDALMAKLFVALQDRITGQLPAIKHVNQDLGQLRVAKPPVSWPCVLIDFESFSFSDLSENVQCGEGLIVVRLGFAPHSDTSQLSPVAYAKKALQYFEIEWALHIALHGWNPTPEAGKMTRTMAETLQRTDAYRVREIKYRISFEDYSTKRQPTMVPADLVITHEVGE